MFAVAACTSASLKPAATTSSLIGPPTQTISNHRCADLIAQSLVQLAPVAGVWDCLEPAVQATYAGMGDRAVAGTSGYFLAPASLIGCDERVCVYSVPLEATTAARAGTNETTLTVWLDGDGLVAYIGIATPVR